MDLPQAVVSMVIFSISLLLGLPIWWNTTKVYRAYLPHQEISAIQRLPLKLKINVEIFFSRDTETSTVEELSKKLDESKHLTDGLCHFEFSFKFKSMHENDNIPARHYCKTLEMNKTEQLFNYRFHIFQNSSIENNVHLYCEDSLDTIFVSRRVNGSLVSDEVMSVLSLYLNTKELHSHCNFANVSKQTRRSRSMPPAVGYRIVFTLAVANPSDYNPSWHIERAINNYFKPLLSKLEFLGPFKISSQILYFVDFKEKPIKLDERFYYSKSKLPLLMNEIQPRLNSYTSTDAGLNFIVYIPPAKYVPLFIKSKGKSNLSATTSFHSARWGGLQFFNPSNVSDGNRVEVPVNSLIKNFLIQYLQLIGVKASEYANVFPLNDVTHLSKWSTTRLLIIKIFEQLKECMNTLGSLSKLLDKIENIVISEEIRHLVESSLGNYKQALKYLQVGSIYEAVKCSKSAFETSEKAFYDASLLALLYFPDDQKYAIYIPLFVPISIPILGSVFRTIKWLKG